MTKPDRLILALAALLLAVFSYFLYDDSLLFPRRSDAGLEKIGQVYLSNNDVRLKTAAAFVWFPAQKTDAVHLQDSVFTGERSEAAIQLQDGTLLSLKPNSLITLNMKNGQMALDLRYGDLASKLNGASSLKITAGDKTFDLEGAGSVQINKSSAGDVGLSILEGGTRLKGAGAEALRPGERLDLGRKGAKAKPAAEGRIEPLTAELLRLDPREPVALQWKSEGDLGGFDAELCSDDACATVVASASTRDQSVTFKDALPDGEYAWRVRGLDKFGKTAATSPVRKLRLLSAAAPVITTPGGDDAKVEGAVKLEKPTDVATGKIELTWKPEPHFASYDLQISADPSFAQPLHAETSAADRVTTPGYPNGVYHYRVRGTLKDARQTAWSAPARFEVALSAHAPQRPNRPVLAKKVFDFNPAEEKKRAPASVPKPLINWSKVKGAAAYQVQLSPKDGSGKPLSYTVKSTAMNWGDYKPGEWQVRVIAIGPDGLKGPPSEPSAVNVVLSEPVLSPIAPVVRRGTEKNPVPPPANLDVRWTEIPFARSYVVQISADKDFADKREFAVAEPAAAVPVAKPGAYHVRVQALDEAGRPLTGFSPAENAAYDFLAPVAPPQLTEPGDRATIFLQTTVEPFIWLEWKKSERAGLYEVELSADPQFRTTLVSLRVAQNRFLIKTQIPTGKLYWRVRSLESETMVSDWAAARQLNILSRKNEGFE